MLLRQLGWRWLGLARAEGGNAALLYSQVGECYVDTATAAAQLSVVIGVRKAIPLAAASLSTVNKVCDTTVHDSCRRPPPTISLSFTTVKVALILTLNVASPMSCYVFVALPLITHAWLCSGEGDCGGIGKSPKEEVHVYVEVVEAGRCRICFAKGKK